MLCERFIFSRGIEHSDIVSSAGSVHHHLFQECGFAISHLPYHNTAIAGAADADPKGIEDDASTFGAGGEPVEDPERV